MLLFISPDRAQKKIKENTRARRLQLELTQEGLAVRSGVPLPTIRLFEQKGTISLTSFLKIQTVLGGLEDILNATQIPENHFSSIDEVLKAENKPLRKRGIRK